MKIYRYRPTSVHTFDEIAHSKVWYSRFSELNDPCEGLYVNRSGDAALDALLSELRICCFSETPDNLLLWAHSADSHRGLCLEYDLTEETYRGQFFPVHYSADLPIVDAIRRYPSGHLDISIERPDGRYFATKGLEWAYEREWRTLVFASDRYAKGQLVTAPGALSAVYFGHRTTDTVPGIVNKLLATNAAALFFRARPDATQYKLGFATLDRATL